MADGARWSRGEPIVVRELHLGRVFSARPGYVVSDEGLRSSFYFPAATQCQWPNDGSRDLRIPAGNWRLVLGSWQPYDQLHVMELGAIQHACVLWQPRTREPAGWKVDFHSPAVRAHQGFDALDWSLDVMVSVDGSYRLTAATGSRQLPAQG